MMSIETVMDAINSKRIVKMKGWDEELHAWAEWTSKMEAENDPALEDYCADVVNAVKALYSGPRNASDHEIQLENSAIEGVTRVHVNWGEQDKTVQLIENLLLDMRRAVRETFHPEIDAERQRWCREQEEAENLKIDTYKYDPETQTAVKVNCVV